jgi:hypothetical protein
MSTFKTPISTRKYLLLLSSVFHRRPYPQDCTCTAIERKRKSSDVSCITSSVLPRRVRMNSSASNESLLNAVPNGMITFRRYAVPSQYLPKWSQSSTNIMPMHLTTSKKIEDIECVLQVSDPCGQKTRFALSFSPR